MAIHKTAVIDKKAEIGKNNDIGPYAIIEGPVHIGDNNRIGPGAIVMGTTVIGSNNQIHGYAYIGNEPQDITFKNVESRVIIGDNNIIREFVTIHRGTESGTATIIGNNNFLLATAHVAHNCKLGNNIVMVNTACVGGYGEIQDNAFISFGVGIHQFTRVGSYAVVGAITRVNKDIPPFMMVVGYPPVARGLNIVGLRRGGFSLDRREMLKRAYKQIYRSGNNLKNSLAELENLQQTTEDPLQIQDLKTLMDFIRSSKRGILLKSLKNTESQ
jgi:UDP-N-acetylglucosamine acyltransferase